MQDTSTYARQVQNQIEQYGSAFEIHDLPKSFSHWTEKFVSPKAISAVGVANPVDFYCHWIIEALTRTKLETIYSVGSGDGAEERRIAKLLLDRGHDNFKFICLELSPKLISEGRAETLRAGLEMFVAFEEVDLNNTNPFNVHAAAVIANQSLHHVLELEHLFAQIKGSIGELGLFITCDMIGRNGHKRWPEVEALLREFWPQVPVHLRHDHQHNSYRKDFENWDCSSEGFEGIRAQDILQLLVSTFYFESYFAFGGLAEVFVDRGLGPNFNLDNPNDIYFLNRILIAEQRLQAAGRLFPTMIWAVLSNSPSLQLCNSSVTKAIRLPSALIEPISVAEAGLGGACAVTIKVRTLAVGDSLTLSNQEATDVLRWGWFLNHDDGFCWAYGESCAFGISSDEPLDINLKLNLLCAGYICPRGSAQNVTVFINGILVGKFSNLEMGNFSWHCILVPSSVRLLNQNNELLVELRVDRYRQPDVDGGNERRPISIALAELNLERPDG